MQEGAIHVGVGGWDYDPWRGAFYPPGFAKATVTMVPAGTT